MAKDDFASNRRMIHARMLVDQAWAYMEGRLDEIDALKRLAADPFVDRRKLDLGLVEELAAMVCSEINQRKCDRIISEAEDFDDGEEL